MIERMIILAVLALIFFGAIDWITPEKPPTPKEPERKVQGWEDDYTPMRISTGDFDALSRDRWR